MKQVIEQYASAVIAVMIAVLCIGSVQGSSLGMVMKHALVQMPYCSNVQFDAYMEKEAPRIQKTENLELLTNQWIRWSDYFLAVDWMDQKLPLYIKEIKTMYGETIYLEQVTPLEAWQFSLPGVYWIELYAIDCNQKKRSVIAKIIVNEGPKI